MNKQQLANKIWASADVEAETKAKLKKFAIRGLKELVKE